MPGRFDFTRYPSKEGKQWVDGWHGRYDLLDLTDNPFDLVREPVAHAAWIEGWTEANTNTQVRRGPATTGPAPGGFVSFTLTVGEDGTLRGYRPPEHPTSQFGALSPTDFWGYEVWGLTCTSGDPQDYQLHFGTLASPDIPFPGVSVITVNLSGWGVDDLVWDGGRRAYYHAVDVGQQGDLYAYLGSRLGQDVTVLLSV